MEKKRAIGLIVLVLVLGAFAWGMLRQREPRYDGEPLSYWLGCYSLFNRTETSGQEATHALEAIGSNAVPTLVRMMQSEDSNLKLRVIALLRKQHVIPINYTPADERIFEALCGFQDLHGKGRQAVPELVKIYQRDLEQINKPHALFQAEAVVKALGSIGPPARNAVPVLSASLPGAPTEMRSSIIEALGKIHSVPEITVPALIQYLRDPSDLTCCYAADALAQFGSDARKAVPALKWMLEQGPALVQESALRALRQIDAAAFAEAQSQANSRRP